MNCFIPFDFSSRTLNPADCLPGWLDNSVISLPCPYIQYILIVLASILFLVYEAYDIWEGPLILQSLSTLVTFCSDLQEFD